MADPVALAEHFLDAHPYEDQHEVEFRGEQYDAGLAWPHFPEGLGGCGANPTEASAVAAVFSARGLALSTMALNPIGYGMAAPTLVSWAAPEVSAHHLRRIFTGDEIWCQMFSEPSSGSDVAGIGSRAVKEVDEWVVTGQKVWTSLAHRASYALLLARTDPSLPKHRGLSLFILDMQSRGIEVVPLFQITGDAEFNEVFLDSVRIPASNMLGQPGDGWRVATTTLMNERVAIGSTTSAGPTPAETLVEAWQARGATGTAPDEPSLRERVLELYVEAEVTRLAVARASAAAKSGVPGPEGSIAKLITAEVSQRLAELTLDLQGSDLMIHADGYEMARQEGTPKPPSRVKRFLRSRAFTIEGGTSEVMRNVLGERVLGLPADLRVDRDVAWSDIPR